MPKDLRRFLKEQFLLRKEKNIKYSLRAFANNIGLDQSLLIKILNGKRIPGSKSMRLIAEHFKLNQRQIEKFVRLNSLETKLLPVHKLTENDIKMANQWFYFAVLELFQIPGADTSIKAISKRLRLPLDTTVKTMERLVGLGLLKEENGKLSPSSANNNWLQSQFTSTHRKALQKQFLQKAKEAVTQVDFSLRENTSLTLAIDRSKLGEFRKVIQEAKDSIRALAEGSLSCNEVYQLVVGFYPLTQTETSHHDNI